MGVVPVLEQLDDRAAVVVSRDDRLDDLLLLASDALAMLLAVQVEPRLLVGLPNEPDRERRADPRSSCPVSFRSCPPSFATLRHNHSVDKRRGGDLAAAVMSTRSVGKKID